MIVSRWLGAPVRTYRPRVPVYDVLYLSLPPVGLAVAAILTDDETRLICGALVLPFALLGAGWLAWSASAVLVLHEHGVLVGRRLGTTRAIPYRSIHPASIATYTRITDIVAAARPVVWPRWFILIGSTDAVSFVGPAHETVAGPGYVPPPVPGDGFVLFATTDAPEAARELRRALVAHGVPAELAWWSDPRSPVRLEGGFVASRRECMPGYSPTWRP